MLAMLMQVVVAQDAIQPHLAIDGSGTAYVVFIRNGQIEISVSADQGRTFSAPAVALDAKGRARGGMQRGPRVAVDGRKTVYVTAPLAFDDAEFAKRYPTQDLFLAVSTDVGKTFSKPVQVNDVPKKAPESLHGLAASPGEGAFVAWLDLRQREKGQDLFTAKVSAKGVVARNQPAAVNLCECCAPGLSMDAQGKPFLIYREGGKTNRQIFLISGGKAARVNQGESKVDS